MWILNNVWMIWFFISLAPSHWLLACHCVCYPNHLAQEWRKLRYKVLWCRNKVQKSRKKISLSLFCVLSVHCSLIFISAISSAWRESIYNRALCCCHSTKKRKNFVIPKHWKGVLLQLKFPPKKRIFLELSEMGKVDESACLHSTKQSRKVFQHPTLTLMKQHSSSSSESGNFYFIFFHAGGMLSSYHRNFTIIPLFWMKIYLFFKFKTPENVCARSPSCLSSRWNVSFVFLRTSTSLCNSKERALVVDDSTDTQSNETKFKYQKHAWHRATSSFHIY